MMLMDLVCKLFIKPSLLNQHTRQIAVTSVLFADPPRKKRRIDPLVFRARVEKKIKKLEREISKLDSEPKQSIPILEYELTNSEIRELKARPRHKMEDFNLNPSTLRASQRLWSIYRLEQKHMEERSIRRVIEAQTAALEELKQLDNILYDKTLELDDASTIVPFRSSHVKRATAPNPSYTPPDGYIKDISKKWVM